MRLPIRLVREREKLSGTLDLAGFVLFFLLLGGFVVNGMIIHPSETLLARFDGDRAPVVILACLMLLVFGGIFFVLLKWLVAAVLATFPGSPYYYTEIGSDGIAVRDGLSPPKRFRWSELSAFSVAERLITLRGGDKEKERWVVAQPGANSVIPRDKKLSYRRAAIRIDPKYYAEGGPAAVNKEFAEWLNAIRDHALSGGVHEVEVPPRFRESILSTPFGVPRD